MKRGEKIKIGLLSLLLYSPIVYLFNNYGLNDEISLKKDVIKEKESISIEIKTTKTNFSTPKSKNKVQAQIEQSNKKIISSLWKDIVMDKSYKVKVKIQIKNKKVSVKVISKSSSKHFNNYVRDFVERAKSKLLLEKDEEVIVDMYSKKELLLNFLK